MYLLLKSKLRQIFLNFSYKREYRRAYVKFLLNKLSLKKNEYEYDLVFVFYSPEKGGRGWILEAICQEIANYYPGKTCFHYSQSSLPYAKAYFIIHYSLVPETLKLNPHIWGSKLLVWYTHPKQTKYSNEELIYALNYMTQVVCSCSQFARLLNSKGVDKNKTTFVLGAADPDLFKPHQRLNGAVGFCTAYYARKSPELVISIIKSMPHRKFILLGRNWNKYENFEELINLPNLSYIEASYANYPKYYALMDVFVSPAKLEGGPIPLIEAMMCNVVPVASKTGFAPDIIDHGKNGFLFDVDSVTEVVCELIEKAYQVQTNIRKTVEHLSWERFSLEIQKFL